MLRDKSGGKSPFFLFQDHYLSFQSQENPGEEEEEEEAGGGGGGCAGGGVYDFVLHDAYERSGGAI